MSIERVALVTGASRGIGAAISDMLGSRDITVVGTATTEEGAIKITGRFAEKGIKGAGMVLDVSDRGSIDQLVKEIAETHGAVSILVNNAGITRDNLMLRMKDDEWEDVINTNLNATYYLIKACLKGMTKARWGRIINVGSVVGSMGNPGQANYAASKGGVAAMARSLAYELGSRNITVNTVAPGFIDTDMTRGLNEEAVSNLLSKIPLGRFGQPEEIAAVVDLLASDAGGYISGETIQVNGGMYMS